MKHEAVLKEDNLGVERSYPHLFLAAVYHDDLEVSNNALKTQFYKQFKLENYSRGYLAKEDKSFDDQLDVLGLEDCKEDDDEEASKIRKSERQAV